jgi:hypothetical protein
MLLLVEPVVADKTVAVSLIPASLAVVAAVAVTDAVAVVAAVLPELHFAQVMIKAAVAVAPVVHPILVV